MLTTRILPPDEWHRVDPEGIAPQSCLTPLLPHLDPARVTIVAVEDDGAIVGRLVWVKVDHVESGWVAPSYRRSTVLGRLWYRVLDLIRQDGGKTMVISADRADTATAAMFAKRGVPFPGQTFVIKV